MFLPVYDLLEMESLHYHTNPTSTQGYDEVSYSAMIHMVVSKPYSHI